VRLTEVEVTDTPKGARLAARAVWDDRSLRPDDIEFVYRDMPASAIVAPGDALVASMLIPAMAVGEDVSIDVPVSAKLLEGAAKAVRINKEWYPKFHASRVEAPIADPIVPTGRVASLFSGGIDSFYSILRPRTDPVTLLVTIVGFDLRFENRVWAGPILSRLAAAADALGRSIIVVDSNAYEVGHRYLVHAEHHGAFLAGAVIGLGCIRRCYIPSSWVLWRLFPPYGSHPATDPLWSTDGTEIVHDAVDVSRVEKGLEIAGNQVVLDHLRVCVRRPDLYNCGRCVKCVATALNLHIAGTLDRCRTLGPVDAATVRKTAIGNPYVYTYRELLTHVREPELQAAIRFALRLHPVHRAAEPIVNILRRRRLRARVDAFYASQGAP
jgi:hypothetical protein